MGDTLKSGLRKSMVWPLTAVFVTLTLVVGIPIGYIAIRAAAAPERMVNSMSLAAAEALRPKITLKEQVLSSVSDLHRENKLVVMSAEVNTDITLDESAESWGIYWGTNTARVAVQNARVQYVIDTGRMETSDYQYDEASHVLNVTFPRPHIDTAQVAIDPAKVQTLDLRGGWMLFDKDETRDHAMAELRPQVIAEASATHFRELADIRGLETTSKLLKPLAEALTRDNISVHVTYRE